MPAERICMRHVHEILRLSHEGVSHHQLARWTGVVPSTVRETLKRFAGSGLVWPLDDEVTDSLLEARMYKNARKKHGRQLADRARLGLDGYAAGMPLGSFRNIC